MSSSSPIPHPDEWPVVALEDICWKIGSGATPKGGQSSYLDERVNYALIRSQNVFDRAFSGDGLAFITDDQARGLKNVELQECDLLLNITGDGVTFSRCCMVPPSILPACVNQHVSIVRVDQEVAHPGYILAFLTHRDVKPYIESFNAGGSRRAITKGHIESFLLPLPPLDVQRDIAQALDNLDEKIELNRQMNTTLESMAQALFKSWFVDFDPVIDNALEAGNPIPESLQARAEIRKALGDQRKPLPEHIQSQFPNSFVFSEEMGWVPGGWDVNSLGECLDVLETGRRPKGGVAKYNEGIPSVGAESINGIGKYDFAKTKYVPEEFFENMKSGKIDSYDVLLYKDGGKPGEFKPRIGMFGNGFPFESFGINEHVFRMKSDKLGQPFLYFQAGSARVFHHLAVRGGKAAIPGINQTEVKSVDFLVPSSKILNNFNEFGYSIIDKILAGAKEALLLAKLRDTLLPKLLSGQLRIPDAEKQLTKAL